MTTEAEVLGEDERCLNCGRPIGETPHMTACLMNATAEIVRLRATEADQPRDGLRAAVEALADEWEANHELIAPVLGHPPQGEVRAHARQLRALLADQPPTPDEGGARE